MQYEFRPVPLPDQFSAEFWDQLEEIPVTDEDGMAH